MNKQEVTVFVTEEEKNRILDSPSHLKHWNFGATCCMRCGISNSELDGLLLQCGKCKKAHYCSLACFNEDLAHHQEFCNTTEFWRQPEAGLPFWRDLLSSSKGGGSSAGNAVEEVGHAVEEASHAAEDMADPAPPMHSNADSIAEDLTEIECADDEEVIFSSRGNVRVGISPQSHSRWEAENITLEAAETIRRQYGWCIPDWILNSPLKRTELGQLVKEYGQIPKDLEAAETMRRQNGLDIPEWVLNSPLKSTELGKLAKELGDIRKECKMSREEPEWVTKSPLRRSKKIGDTSDFTTPTKESEGTGREVGWKTKLSNAIPAVELNLAEENPASP